MAKNSVMVPPYAVSLINGLVTSEAQHDTKPARILSGLLIRANSIVDGDSLVEAGWFEDVSAGATSKIRGYRRKMSELLLGTTHKLEPKGAGAYQLQINESVVDLHDLTRRFRDAQTLKKADPTGALRLLEPVLPLLRAQISTLGVIPATNTVWDEDLQAAQRLRTAALEWYFMTILTGTRHSGARLLRLLSDIQLDSVPSLRLWELKVGLTAEFDEPSLAATRSAAQIALTRFSLPTLDIHQTADAQAELRTLLGNKGDRPSYEVPAPAFDATLNSQLH